MSGKPGARFLLLILAKARGSWPGGVPFADDPPRSGGKS
jgi:hypothetical protein